jgi:hypothetical protein
MDVEAQDDGILAKIIVRDNCMHDSNGLIPLSGSVGITRKTYPLEYPSR